MRWPRQFIGEIGRKPVPLVKSTQSLVQPDILIIGDNATFAEVVVDDAPTVNALAPDVRCLKIETLRAAIHFYLERVVIGISVKGLT